MTDTYSPYLQQIPPVIHIWRKRCSRQAQPFADTFADALAAFAPRLLMTGQLNDNVCIAPANAASAVFALTVVTFIGSNNCTTIIAVSVQFSVISQPDATVASSMPDSISMSLYNSAGCV